jgi:Methyltransferase domain
MGGSQSCVSRIDLACRIVALEEILEISLSRRNNELALLSLASWLDVDSSQVLHFYREIIEDKEFLKAVSIKIESNIDFKSSIPGLFTKVPIENPDWFGLQRILLYCLTRLLKPKIVVETGVYYGGNTAFILNALDRNGEGQLIAIDLPQSTMKSEEIAARHPWVGDSELYDSNFLPGFIVPESLRSRLRLILGDSKEVLKGLNQSIDFFVHDSEHTISNVLMEMETVWKKMSTNGMLLVDDIDWSNGFFSFIVDSHLYPLLLTDNGKDGLRVRTGLVKRDHKNNKLSEVTLI